MIVLVATAALVCIAGALVATHWPYSERMVVPSLEDTFKTRVMARQFRRFYFPSPGCEADEVVLAHPENRAGAPPLATVRRMTIRGRYIDLLFRPSHIETIQLDGLQVRVPPPSERNFSEQSDSASSKATIGFVVVKNATLEIASEERKEPLRFEIHDLRLTSVAAGTPVNYEVRMTNPVPRGELESEGTFGPWTDGRLEGTPLHGSVKFTDGQLDDLAGIGGTLQSELKFRGTLDSVDIKGSATSTDFHLKTTQHRISLAAQFEVLLNALKGEARIQQVNAKMGQTPFRVQGSVAKNAKVGRRETVLDFAIPRGRVEDALWLFNTAAKPPMIGPASGSAHVRIPKFGAGFLKGLELNGKFEIADGGFQKDTQAKMNHLSARAQGIKIDAGNEPAEVTTEALDSDVMIRKGSAYFPELFFMIPGAHARLQGTYDLDSHEVKMQGNLWTLATISQDSDGIKSILLKPIDPLFKRKHSGARVGITLSGDVDNPKIGVILTRDKTPTATHTQ